LLRRTLCKVADINFYVKKVLLLPSATNRSGQAYNERCIAAVQEAVSCMKSEAIFAKRVLADTRCQCRHNSILKNRFERYDSRTKCIFPKLVTRLRLI